MAGPEDTLPSTAKKGKKSKKDKKWKDKSGVAMKKEGRIHKRKKNNGREGLRGMKDKRKKSKDRAMKLAVEGDFILTQANSASHQSEPWLKANKTLAKKSAGCPPQGCEQPFLDGSPSILTHRKVTRTKKKVAFELEYGSSVAKYPKVIYLSTQLPELNVSSSVQSLAEGEDGEGVLKKRCQTEPQNNSDSQCTSDDINSQDLFITQKIFRAPSIDQSSEETTEEGIAAMAIGHQYGVMQGKVIHRHKSTKRPDHYRLAYEEHSQLTGKASTQSQKLEMEDMSLKPIPCRCIALNNAETIQPAHTTPKRNSFLVKPKPLSLSIGVKKTPDYLVSKQAIPEPLPTRKVSTAATSTQTDNFFTTELCCYLKFLQQRRLHSNRLEFTALDLSLPLKMRTDPGTFLLDSIKTSTLMVKGEVAATGAQTSSLIHSAFRPGKREDFSVPPPSSPNVKVNNGALDSQGKVETPSPQSEAEPKSSETTTSSEDNEASGRSGRADLMQMKAVQMRLNESFFFKAKGEGLSPRPESPLMKLSQGREKKSRKKH